MIHWASRLLPQVITLPLVLGALESRTRSWSHHVSSGDYLDWLSANDYPLAAVEEVITAAKTAEEVYTQYLADAVKD